MPDNQPASVAVSVVVADKSLIHSELLADAIGKDRSIQVVGAFSGASAVVEGVLCACPDVLLISAAMDEIPTCGFDILREVLRTRSDLKAIVLLDSSRREVVLQAFRSGARGVFCLNEPVKTLCKCISAVYQGQIWANTRELGFLLEALAASASLCSVDASALITLSDRERDVVRCVAEGLANQEIAERLAISQHTVKNYMFRIFEKLGVSSRLELLLYVLSRAGHSREVLNQLRSSGSRNNADPESANTQSVGERKSVTGVKAVGSQMPAKMHEIRQMTGHGSV